MICSGDNTDKMIALRYVALQAKLSASLSGNVSEFGRGMTTVRWASKLTESGNLNDYANELDQAIEDRKISASAKKNLDEEINSVENELSEFRNKSGDKINKIAAETSAELIKELIGEEVNSSSIAAIVEEQGKLNKERKDVV